MPRCAAICRARSTAVVASLALLLTLGGCEDSTAPDTDTSITSGWSFGECVGLCHQEVVFRATIALYSQRSWDPSVPDIEGEVQIPREEWQKLLAAVDMQTLQALPDVLGCPDCADGGAEWIDVELGSTQKRVTFEFGAAIPSIQPLLDLARARRVEILPEQ